MTDLNYTFTFENVSFGYLSRKGNITLIENFSGYFEQGEFIIIIGKNGTGKSTFLKSLVKLLPLIKGKINLNERILENYSLSEYAKLISFVSTSIPRTVRMTVFELVSLGRLPYTNWLGSMNKEDYKKVIEAIEATNLKEHLNKQISTVSDGERQRAMIARTLAQDTPIIMLDEPTAFLDLPNKYELAGLLSKLTTMGKTIIMSTHDIEIALRFPDKLLIINDKALIYGSPEDLVLRGEFDKIFSSNDLSFNKLTGEIENSVKQDKEISIQSNEDVLLTWTKKALKRAGFGISEKEKNRANIEVVMENESYKLNLQLKDQTYTFWSIYDLIKFLKTKFQ